MVTIPSFHVSFKQQTVLLDRAKSGAETMDAYSIGGGLALLADGWKSGSRGNGWTEMLNEDAPRRAVHHDGRVRVFRDEWRDERSERSLEIRRAMQDFVYGGPRLTFEAVFNAAYQTDYEAVITAAREKRYEHRQGTTLVVCQFVDSIPAQVEALAHKPRPGMWQAALLILGGTEFWFEDDVAAVQEMARGFYAHWGEDVPEAEAAMLQPVEPKKTALAAVKELAGVPDEEVEAALSELLEGQTEDDLEAMLERLIAQMEAAA